MIMIYGTHDDLVNIVDLHANAERIDALDKEVSILVGTAAAGLVVRFEYAPKRTPRNGLGGGATWQVKVDLVGTEVPISWPAQRLCSSVEVDLRRVACERHDPCRFQDGVHVNDASRLVYSLYDQRTSTLTLSKQEDEASR